MNSEELCPCASGKKFGECCEPIIARKRVAATAEELMRARYTAYAVCDVKFLFDSSGPEVRAEFDEKTTCDWSKNATWSGLEILSSEKGGEGDDEGFGVEFKDFYDEWRFVDGEMQTGSTYRREEPKVGRNDPCPCGSGKKYKKCCGKNA